MADLYGSQDVTIRNDDGSKVVDITTDAATKNRLDSAAIIVDGTTGNVARVVGGRLAVAAVPAGAVTLVLGWAGNNAPYKANMWLLVQTWDVPSGGYIFNPFQIQYSAGNSSSSVKASKRLALGSFNNTTQTFTDGLAYTAPDFGSYLDLNFTADVGTAATITITYTNEIGTTGRTATYAMTSGAGGDKNGHIIRVPLQSGDTGIRDITNVTTSASGTATFTFLGKTDIFLDSADASGVVYTDTLPLEAFVMSYPFTVGLYITSASTAPVDRVINLTALLIG